MDNEYLKSLKNAPVILFGAGQFGAEMKLYLNHYNIDVAAFCDNSKVGNYCGLPVIAPHEAVQTGRTIIVCSDSYADAMCVQLDNIGGKNYLRYYQLFPSSESRAIEVLSSHVFLAESAYKQILYRRAAKQNRNTIIIPSVELVVTERCSLKCRDCANLMQYYTKPRDADINVQLCAMESLLSADVFIGRILIIGGEPLMNRRLPQYIDALNQSSLRSKFGFLNIVTNGTILPNEQLCSSLQNPGVSLSISNYGELSLNLKAIEDQARSVGYRCYVNEIGERWHPFGEIFRQPCEDENIILHKFKTCSSKICKTILDGKLFICPFAAHAQKLHAIPKAAEESVALQNKPANLQDLMLEFCNKEPFAACAYCPGRDDKSKMIPAAIQTKSPVPYFVNE